MKHKTAFLDACFDAASNSVGGHVESIFEMSKLGSWGRILDMPESDRFTLKGIELNSIYVADIITLFNGFNNNNCTKTQNQS